MLNVNKVFIGGRLTRDPELKYTPSGKSVCEFSVAVNKSGKPDNVVFVDVVVWGVQGESCDRYLRKGSPVFIDGSLDLTQWEDPTTGKKRSKIRIHAWNVQFVDSSPNQTFKKGNDMINKTIIEMHGKAIDEYTEVDGERIYGWKIEDENGESPSLEKLGEGQFIQLYWSGRNEQEASDL